MLIAQISDCHVVEPGRHAYGRVDTGACLEAAVAALNALPAQPDLVLATGDLVQQGAPGEYRRFRAITERLRAPLFVLAGNHDARGALAEAVGPALPGDGFFHYAIEHFPVRVLALDTVTPGSDEPSFCAGRLDWLRARLEEDPRPTVLGLHHPPFAGPVGWINARDPAWASPLEGLVRAYPHVRAAVCGHVHRAGATLWAGIQATTAPSTAHQLYPDFTPGAPAQISLEAPGFQVHAWSGDALVTLTIALPGLHTAFAP